MSNIQFIIIMGVSGCGKSSIGSALAERLSAPFLDGDDFHPKSNKAKMASGHALSDEDRWPWFDALTTAMKLASKATRNQAQTDDRTAPIQQGQYPQNEQHQIVIAACSSLKRSYRDYLQSRLNNAASFVHLHGEKTLILSRLNARNHEYMPASLLDSQFETLEDLDPDETAILADIALPVSAILTKITNQLNLP